MSKSIRKKWYNLQLFVLEKKYNLLDNRVDNEEVNYNVYISTIETIDKEMFILKTKINNLN
jgi:hypothetical protein